MGDLDERERRAGELGRDAADDLLMGMMGHGEVEGRFPELDGEDIEKAGKNPGKVEYQRFLMLQRGLPL